MRGDASLQRALLAAALTVMSGFFASKVLGLVRSIIVGAQYGATREYELFLAAMGVTDTVFQVLAGGSVGAAFIPVFASYLNRDERTTAWRFCSALLNWAILGIGCVAAGLALIAPALMALLVPGWSPAEQAEAAHLTRILLAAPVIFSASALVTSILNGVQRFALGAAAPLAYNLALIVGATLLRPWGTEGLAFSAIAGALLHLVVQLPGLWRVGMRFSFTLGRDLAGTHEVLRLMGPRVLSLGITQVNQLAGLFLASFLVAGSVAYLNYAWMILMAPLGILAMGLATAIFPTLAAQSAAGDNAGQQRTFSFGLRLIWLGTTPATIALAALAHPVVSLLLERGAFSASHAAATAVALGLYAVGLPGHATTEIASRAFFAMHDTATPVKAAGLALVANLLLSLAFMQAGLSFGGLALANALAAMVEAALLAAILHRRTGWIGRADFGAFIARLALAAGGMALVISGVRAIMPAFIETTGVFAHIITLLSCALVGGVAFFGLALLLGIDEVKTMVNRVRRRR